MNRPAFRASAIKVQSALEDLPAILRDITGLRAGVEGRSPED